MHPQRINGPFVYRLGRQVFILERGVRFPYGLQIINELKQNLRKMANHKSSIKRIRQTLTKRLRNKYYAKTTRNAVRDLRAATEKEQACEQYKKVSSMLDRLAKKNIIHKNKAGNLKSKLALHVNKLS